MKRSLERFALASMFCAGGCVLPRFELSGAELSWFAAESNDVDGDEARRVRSCEGGVITTVEFLITDDDDDDRNRQFGWSCEEGYRTPAQFFTGASDVFVELDPGSYEIEVSSVDDPALRGGAGSPLAVSQDVDTVAIGSDDATLLQWELHPVAVDLELELAGTAACAQMTARLVYADPERMLPDLEEEVTDAVVYRTALASSGGLALGGLATPCADLQDGLDVVPGVDRGAYVLEVRVDDADACLIDVVLDGRQGPVALDLTHLPC